MTDLFLNIYKGYAPKEAGALSYYAKALAHNKKLFYKNKTLPITNIFGKGGIKALSFDEKKALLQALKNDVTGSLSVPKSHRHNKLLQDLRNAASQYYRHPRPTPPKDLYDFYRRLQEFQQPGPSWTPLGNGADEWVTQYHAPYLQGVKGINRARQQAPQFSIR